MFHPTERLQVMSTNLKRAVLAVTALLSVGLAGLLAVPVAVEYSQAAASTMVQATSPSVLVPPDLSSW